MLASVSAAITVNTCGCEALEPGRFGAIRAEFPDARIIVLTTYADDAQHLLALINDILGPARIEAGRTELNPGAGEAVRPPAVGGGAHAEGRREAPGLARQCDQVRRQRQGEPVPPPRPDLRSVFGAVW